jgi:hypothetical protein
MTDEVLHSLVGERYRARVENDARRVGVSKADDRGLFSRKHEVQVKKSAKRRDWECGKSGVLISFPATSPLALARALRHL